MQKIFFSYSRIDGSDFALRLALDLKKEGFDVWIDQEDIRAGSEWDIEIEKALETCDYVLFIETEKSVISNNVLDEVYYALDERKKVIPLILIDSKTPFRLKRLQHIDFTKSYETGLILLLAELKENIATTHQPEVVTPLVKVNENFYKKYAGLILIIASFVIIVAAIFIYIVNSRNLVESENYKNVPANDTTSEDQQIANTELEGTQEKDTLRAERINDKKIIPQRVDKAARTTPDKLTSTTSNETLQRTGNTISNLNETFAGDWQLISIEPKAQSAKGYLKIITSDDKKVSIKTYIQFYYFKTNDTSYLTVFNAFAGCPSCMLEKEMKITAEDIAVGSQVYKILKQDLADGGKIGDTIMQAGINKSIQAGVTLHLIDNTTAVIKVQQPKVTTLSHGLILKPFMYTFRFTKID